MKYTDIKLTRSIYNASAANKGGTFNPPLGVMRNFGYDPQNITEADLDRIFSTYATSAFDDIDAFNPDRPLPRIIWNDLSSTIQDTLNKSLILQINELLKNGLAERTETSTASTGSFTANTTPNTKIVSPDQLSQDVEDELDKIQYKSWKVEYNENGILTIFIDDIDAIIPKTKNSIALSALIFKQLDNADLNFIGEKYAVKLIQSEISSALSFRGTWNADNIIDYGNIDTIFTSTGLPLTDGTTTLTSSNTNKGDVILITITSDNDFRPEEAVYDGTKWVIITNNNEEDKEIDQINIQLNKEFFQKTSGKTSIKGMDGTNDDNLSPSIQLMKIADKVIDDKVEKNKDDIISNVESIDNEKIRNDEQQGEINNNTEGRILWENESADYIRFGDIAGSILIPLNNLLIKKVGQELHIDTSNEDFTKLVNGVIVTIKLIPKPTSQRKDPIFIRDSYNDTTEIPNSLLGQVDIKVSIEKTLTTIKGLNITNEQILIDDYFAILIEQLPGNIAGIDNVARNLAKQAQVDATAANNNAEKRAFKNLSNVLLTEVPTSGTLEKNDYVVAFDPQTGIANKRPLPQMNKPTNLVKGTDFNTFNELNNLLDERSLYCITIDNDIIIGRVSNASLNNANEIYIIGGRQKMQNNPNLNIIASFAGLHTIKNNLTVEDSDGMKSFELIAKKDLPESNQIGNDFEGTFTDESKVIKFLNVGKVIPDELFKNQQLTKIYMSDVTTVGASAFDNNTALTEANFPQATTVGDYAFYQNTSLTKINSPKVTTISQQSFIYTALTEANFPQATTVGALAFNGASLTEINFPQATTIGDSTFINNADLTKATLKSQFNTTAEKDRIFGAGQWQNITFTWV